MRIPQPVAQLADRLRPRIPERAWPLLRTIASVTGDGPLVGLPALRSVVVVAPHPDDETIGPGGTLALLARAGVDIHVVIVTGGELSPGTGFPPGEVAHRRMAEAEEACARLGLAAPKCLGQPDGSVADRVSVVAGGLAGVLTDTAPDAVFVPWFGDGHPDHRAVNDALDAAMGRPGVGPAPEIWAYETWTPLPATRLVDITSSMPTKQSALDAHVTARAAFDLDAMTGLNRYRSVHGLAGRGWAEAFLAMPVARYFALAAACRPEASRG